MKKGAWFLLALLLIGLSSFVIQKFSFMVYRQPVATVKQVQFKANEEVVELQLLNRSAENITVSQIYYPSGATIPHYQNGDQVILKNSSKNFEIESLKRDGYFFFLLAAFSLIVLFIGGKKAVLALAGIGLNLVLLIGFLWLNQQFSQVPLTLLISLYSIVAVTVSMASAYGGKNVDLRKVGATLVSIFGAYLICYTVMQTLKDKGLRYEEMQFLTRPYRSVYFASLILGALGAAMDNVVTLIASLDELKKRNSAISPTKLIQAGRTIAADTTSSMINVLLFAYLSSAVPMLLFYLANGWSFKETLSLHLSLEILRALCGGIALLLSVPVALGIFIWSSKEEVR